MMRTLLFKLLILSLLTCSVIAEPLDGSSVDAGEKQSEKKSDDALKIEPLSDSLFQDSSVALKKNVTEQKLIMEKLPSSHDVQSQDAIQSVVIGLVFVIVLIIGASFLVKRFSNFQGRDHNKIQFLSVKNIGTKEKIAIIQAGDKQILVGITPQNINALYVFDEPVIIDTKAQPDTHIANQKAPHTFQSILKGLTKGQSLPAEKGRT